MALWPVTSNHQQSTGKDVGSFGSTPVAFLAGVSNIFLFSPLPGEDSDFDSYFSKGLKPPTSVASCCNRKKSNGNTEKSLGPAIQKLELQDVMIQSIPNFVQESAVGNTQRVKNAVDIFCGWYCGWFRSPRSPPKGCTVQNLWIIG